MYTPRRVTSSLWWWQLIRSCLFCWSGFSWLRKVVSLNSRSDSNIDLSQNSRCNLIDLRPHRKSLISFNSHLFWKFNDTMAQRLSVQLSWHSPAYTLCANAHARSEIGQGNTHSAELSTGRLWVGKEWYTFIVSRLLSLDKLKHANKSYRRQGMDFTRIHDTGLGSINLNLIVPSSKNLVTWHTFLSDIILSRQFPILNAALNFNHIKVETPYA